MLVLDVCYKHSKIGFRSKSNNLANFKFVVSLFCVRSVVLLSVLVEFRGKHSARFF